MKKFITTGIPTVEINNLGTVKITEGNNNEVAVIVKGSEKSINLIDIKQYGDRISINGPKLNDGSGVTVISKGSGLVNIRNVNGSSTIVHRSSTIVSDGNIVITGNQNKGRIIVNGVDITDTVNEKSGNIENEPAEVIISAPLFSMLQIGNILNLSSTITHDSVDAKIKGNCYINIKEAKSISGSISGNSEVFVGRISQMLNISVSGQSELEVNELTGGLMITSAGQSSANISGNLTDVNSSSSGQSHISTFGSVAGNYIASSSGQASIYHNGSIAGQISKSESGQSTVKIR